MSLMSYKSFLCSATKFLSSDCKISFSMVASTVAAKVKASSPVNTKPNLGNIVIYIINFLKIPH